MPYVRVSDPGAPGKMDRLMMRFFWKRVYKKNGAVSCVGSDLLYWNTMLDQIRLWADIDRNCNTFFVGHQPIFSLYYIVLLSCMNINLS